MGMEASPLAAAVAVALGSTTGLMIGVSSMEAGVGVAGGVGVMRRDC